MCERVSAHNRRWDETLMLENIFYLNDPALVWFRTNEEALTSWNIWKQQRRDLFKSVDRRLAAKKGLALRAQSSTESYVTHILAVLALCSKGDLNMSQSDKVGCTYLRTLLMMLLIC